MKTCNNCKIEKDLNEMTKDKITKTGYSNICKACNRIKSSKYREDKELYKKYCEEYYNRENIKEKRKKDGIIYREKNKEKLKIQKKEWREKNKEKLKIQKKEWIEKQKENNTNYHLSQSISANFRKIFRKNGFSKKSRTIEILGCSFEEFKLYLESKFEDWMTWENKGLYNGELNHGWDIDHIIPLASAKTEDDIIRLNHYKNLQPLCSKFNRDIKKDKILF